MHEVHENKQKCENTIFFSADHGLNFEKIVKRRCLDLKPHILPQFVINVAFCNKIDAFCYNCRILLKKLDAFCNKFLMNFIIKKLLHLLIISVAFCNKVL